MDVTVILFFILAALTLLSALLTITSKQPVYSILYLIVVFFSISAHYVLLNAQFLAVVNIIVYGGAIMVLFLFTIMLMNLNKGDTNFSKPAKIIAGSLVSLIFFVLTVRIFFQSGVTDKDTISTEGDIGLTETLGDLLYSEYVVPFELASILFMASMIGAILLSKRTHDLKVKD